MDWSEAEMKRRAAEEEDEKGGCGKGGYGGG